MQDILFKTDDSVFSYRVAGVCIENGAVLLQTCGDDPGYAFPGGHASFGETNADTLRREFREEIGADISVGSLRWVGEIFFPWGTKPCHQICLYYDVSILDSVTPRAGTFEAAEHLEGRSFRLNFHWVSLTQIEQILLYPTNAAGLLGRMDAGVQHFVYREQG